MLKAFNFLTFYFIVLFHCPAFSKDLLNYSANYEEARKAFLDKTAKLKKEYSDSKSYSLKVPSSIDNDLTIDAFHLKFSKANNNKILVLCSGVHGLEAAVGSFVQALIMLPNFIGILEKSKVDLLLVHAINPYGFKYHRRVTENNVDLNRNFVLKDNFDDIKNDDYTKLRDFLQPKENLELGFFDKTLFYLKSIFYMSKYSIKTLRWAILSGQYEYSTGLYFGGKKYEPHKELVETLLGRIFKKYEAIHLIDIHTGYGQRAKLHLFPNPIRKDLRPYLSKLYSDEVINYGDESEDFYSTTGEFSGYFYKFMPNKNILPMVWEFGTADNHKAIKSIDSIHTMIIENQGHHHGYAHGKTKAKVNSKILELFNPKDIAWKKEIKKQSIEMLEKVILRFGKMTFKVNKN